MATTESTTASKRVRRRMLGLPLHDWETVMALSLAVAALAAAIVGVSTWIVIQLTRDANRESARQIAELATQGEQLRRDTAEANERSVKAQLALEKFRRPRVLPIWKMPEFERILKPFAGTPYVMMAMNDPEQLLLASRLRQAFTWAKWQSVERGVPSANGIELLPEYDGIEVRIDQSRRDEWWEAAQALVGILHADKSTLRRA